MGKVAPSFLTTVRSPRKWPTAHDQRIRIGLFFLFFIFFNNSKLWLIDFLFLPWWHCCFSFSTQHERQWNKNILAANWPHHGNSIDQPSQVLRKIYPSCQFPCINSSAATRALNRQPWYLASGNKIYNHNLASLMIHLSQRSDTKWPDDIRWEQSGK